jgi:hypothetical protein
MKLYGFLPSFPIVCHRNGDKHLIVKDGQHRLAIAEELGLPVHFVDETIDFDVAVINCTPKTWTLRDYAEKFIAQGHTQYATGLEFAERHHIPLGTAFALLSGTCNWSNVTDAFVSGKFTIKDAAWAECVGAVYSTMVAMSDNVRSVRFLEACMAVARVEGFDADRLLRSAKQCRDRLVAYSTRDAYLEMLEYVYNFHKQKTLPLKFLAIKAMHDRNAVKVAKAKKATAKA